MRTLNAFDQTPEETEHLAFVKACGCVFCGRMVPTQAHHPRHCQGLHFRTISVCSDCHELHVWSYCGISESEAENETHRRVHRLHKGLPIESQPCAYFRKHTGRQNSTRTPYKIMARRL